MLIVYNAVKLCHKVDKEMPPDSYASDLNLDQLKISVNVNKRSLHCKFATKEISSGTAPSIFFIKDRNNLTKKSEVINVFDGL